MIPINVQSGLIIDSDVLDKKLQDELFFINDFSSWELSLSKSKKEKNMALLIVKQHSTNITHKILISLDDLYL